MAEGEIDRRHFQGEVADLRVESPFMGGIMASAGGLNTLLAATIAPMKPTNPQKLPRFIATPGWLRPVIRWSTRFSLNAPAWVPDAVRNAPLRLSSWLLRRYASLLR